MGRPIKKRFFGNLNSPFTDIPTSSNSGVGGEAVNTITVSNSGTNYSAGTVVTIGAPQIAGGVPATISYSRNSAGSLTVTKLTGGTGYTSAPSLTVTKAATVNTVGTATNASFTLTDLTSVAGIQVGMLVDAPFAMQSESYVAGVSGNSVTLTKTMTTSTATLALTFSDAGASFASSTALTSASFENAIAFTSFLLAKDGGANAVAGGDIHKQESSRRYLVENSEGIGQVKLIASDSVTAGTMKIIATDGGGATYFVRKLTAKKAYLVNRTSTSTALVSGLVAQWTTNGSAGNVLITAATGTTQVSIANN